MRSLVAIAIDLLLRLNRDRLVRRQGIDAEESRRVTGQPIDRHHADPIIDGIAGAIQRRALQQISA